MVRTAARGVKYSRGQRRRRRDVLRFELLIVGPVNTWSAFHVC
jgi:hypothetical protein